MPVWPGFRHRFSRQGRKGRRQCPNCGAWLAPTNGYILSAAFGGILGITIAASRELGLHNEWIRTGFVVALAVVLGTMVAPLLLVWYGRWQVIPDGYSDSPEVKRWARVRDISTWVAVVAVFVGFLSVPLGVRYADSCAARLSSGEAADALLAKALLAIFLPLGCGLLVGIAGMAVGFYADLRRRRAMFATRSE